MQEEDILQKPLVAIVILNWNGKSFLEQFLPSVMATTYQPHDIYVADNASTDDSISFLEKNYPSIKVIPNSQNDGFAKGYNYAMQYVNADYAILLNSDVEVTPEWIEPLVDLLNTDPFIAACQPKIKSYNNKTLFEHAGAAGGYIDFLGYPFCKGRIFDSVEEDSVQYENNEEIFWASGAALCVRLELFKRFKGLDEDFFAHMEEIDLCWRFKRAGYKIFVVPQSVVYHVGGGSLQKENPKKIYLNFRNNLFMLFKNYEIYEVVWKLPFRYFVMDFIALLKALVQRKWKEAGAIIKADFHFLLALPKLIKKRYLAFILFWKHRIEPSRVKKKGFYNRSIVWKYFIQGKDKFTDL